MTINLKPVTLLATGIMTLTAAGSASAVDLMGVHDLALKHDPILQAADYRREAIEETAGGYAGAQSEAFLAEERKLLAEHVADVDIVITTAVIPGQDAPILITEEMVRSMRPGSVIVDLAVERGGNCALTKSGQRVDVNGVHILGYADLPSRMAPQASTLYARTLLNLLKQAWGEDGFRIDLEDEIVGAVALTHAGNNRRSTKEA